MGAGIAQLACLGRFETYLHDPVPDGARARASAASRGAGRGSRARPLEREAAEAAAARLRAAPRLEDLAGCELVIEAAPEDLELKRELFARLAGSAARRRSSPPTPPRSR